MHTIKRSSKCHDIMDKVGDCWNQNLKKCLKDKGYTQETFAEAYKKRYGTGNQASVNRWLNVGSTQGKDGNKIGLPSYDTMKRIADFFNVTVGYLTGETDYETFEMERACNYLEITESAGKSLKRITGSTDDCIEWGYESEKYQRIICDFFTADKLSNFIVALKRLDDVYTEDALVYKKLESRYREEALEEVICLQDDEIDYKHDPNAPRLTPHQIEVWNALDNAENTCYENHYKIKYARYELHDAFERLIDSLYPR